MDMGEESPELFEASRCLSIRRDGYAHLVDPIKTMIGSVKDCRDAIVGGQRCVRARFAGHFERGSLPYWPISAPAAKRVAFCRGELWRSLAESNRSLHRERVAS